MKKEYYRMQVKLDYVNDDKLIEAFKNVKNKQEFIRHLYYYAKMYGHLGKILKTLGREKKDD